MGLSRVLLLLHGVFGLALCACAGTKQADSSDQAGGGSDQAGGRPDLPTTIECPDADESAALRERYLEGKALLASCGEACMKGEGGGEDRNKGLSLLREAAESGDLDAQSLYGRVLFGDLMTTGQEEALQDQYIEAIYYLRLSIRRGDAAALAFLPDLENVRAMPTGFFPSLSPPLSDIDEDWVRAGILKADRARPCPRRDQ